MKKLIHFYYTDGLHLVLEHHHAMPLKMMQEYVGGLIEVAHVQFKGKRTDMVVNEEGAINGMPINAAATVIYHIHSVENRTGINNQFNGIYGDAIVFENCPLE